MNSRAASTIYEGNNLAEPRKATEGRLYEYKKAWVPNVGARWPQGVLGALKRKKPSSANYLAL